MCTIWLNVEKGGTREKGWSCGEVCSVRKKESKGLAIKYRLLSEEAERSVQIGPRMAGWRPLCVCARVLCLTSRLAALSARRGVLGRRRIANGTIIIQGNTRRQHRHSLVRHPVSN